MAIQIDTTTNYAVYLVSGTVKNGRVYFEHLDLGEDRCATAIIKNSKVVDLDGCADLTTQQRNWLTNKNVQIDF